MSMSKHSVFWFRRDLRLHDNSGLRQALESGRPVIPIFIFDSLILEKLKSPQDLRVQFLHETLLDLKGQLNELGSDLLLFHGKPLEIFQALSRDYKIESIFTNHDYEPYPRRRDREISDWAKSEDITFQTFKDQVIFEKSEITTDQNKPYTVYTPFKKKWLLTAQDTHFKAHNSSQMAENFFKSSRLQKVLSLESLGFDSQTFLFPTKKVSKKVLTTYTQTRDYPALDQGTTQLGLHLRFGTVSVREMAKVAKENSDVWLSELIWREFFMQILWHYPDVVKASFRPAYDKVAWRDNAADFKKWCEGQTGYPMVDAGMRQLNQTGYMHNRVRMVTASFLTKHLLIHWLKGERYFAAKLLDYDLSANNGNWQWAAGTGCDAAPYFRIFNPESQLEKFDPNLEYVKSWVPEFGTKTYPEPMVEHTMARERCLTAFKTALNGEKT